MDLGLKGRSLFIAAGTRGLGFACARVLAEEGASVGICGRDEDSLAAAAANLRETGSAVLARRADVRKTNEITAAIDAAAAAHGGLDGLVVNAGGPSPGTFRSLGDDAWQDAFELTLMSAVHLVRAALPHLDGSDAASITFIVSLSVKQPIDGLLLSNAVRSSVTGLAKTLSRELAPRIRVNSVLPGNLRTSRTEELARNAARPGMSVDDVIAERARGIPLGRYGDPMEMGRLVAFLSSPAASYLTGLAIPVDGGVAASTL